MAHAPYAIGVDIGGTRIKAAAVDEDGHVMEKRIVPTLDGRPATSDATPVWAHVIGDQIAELETAVGYPASRIGLAAPGLAARDGRSIAFMPGRLKGLEGFDWTDYLQRDAVTPIVNDAQAAILGETWIGAGRGVRNAILITLGTGVGGAVMSDGRLLHGAIGRAGHLGHICLDMAGEPGITRIPGSLENAIGECTLAQRTGGRFANTQALAEAAQNDDAAAAQVWNDSIRALGCAIASFINILDPELVILGGGNAQLGSLITEPLNRVLDDIEWRPGGHTTPIVIAQLGEMAGTVGAARNALIHGLH